MLCAASPPPPSPSYRLVREELTDEELCADMDLSDDDEDGQKGAVGGAGGKRQSEFECPDSSLSPSARIRLYFNQSWRMEVIVIATKRFSS